MTAPEQARIRLARREWVNLGLVMLEALWGRLPRAVSRPLGRTLRRLPGLGRYGRPA